MQRKLPFFSSLLQGATFLIYPAASDLLTERLSIYLYGFLFIPMMIGTIIAAFLGRDIKSLWPLGNLFNAIAMGLFALGGVIFHPALFLLSLFFLGLGYGALTTALPPMMKELFPGRAHRSIMALFSLFVVGSALMPTIYYFSAVNFAWWSTPLCISLLFFVVSYAARNEKSPQIKTAHVSWSFWPYLTTAFLFGVTSTVFNNWIIPFLTQDKGFSVATASFNLSLFWWMTLLGRASLLILEKYRQAFILSPWIAAAALALPLRKAAQGSPG
jgi:fucose permease